MNASKRFGMLLAMWSVLLAATLLIGHVVSAVCAAEDKTAEVLEDSWEAVYIGGKKAGHVHTVTRKVKLDDGREAIEVVSDSFLRLRRFGQTIQMEIRSRSLELAKEGHLLETETITRSSNIEVMRTKARVEGKELVITVNTLGKTSTRRIPWANTPGPYALDQQIGNAYELAEGETKEVEFFDASFQAMVKGRIIGGKDEEVQLLDRSAKLRHVKFEIFLPGQAKPFVTTDVWLNKEGDALKSHTPLLGGMVTYRVSKEVALAEPEELAEDIAVRTLVPIDGQLDRPFETTKAVYRLHLAEGVDPSDLPLAKGPTQQYELAQDGTILLTVFAEPQGPDEPKPGPKFLRSNSYLQSDNPKVRAYAKEAVGDAQDPLEQAIRMERWVFQNLTNKNFGVGFASAAAVAESMEGDCTEHAVLLAAMARAQGLPARVAIGFVYAPSVGQFGGHMWTEIYIDGHWRGFDATLGRGRPDAVHIKLGDSALDGAEAMLTLLPIARAIEMIKKIEVVEVTYEQ